MPARRLLDGIPIRDCVGCGFCCRKGPCGLALQYNLWTNKKCSALVFKDGWYQCELLLVATGEVLESWKREPYIGEGCCCGLNSDRKKYL